MKTCNGCDKFSHDEVVFFCRKSYLEWNVLGLFDGEEEEIQVPKWCPKKNENIQKEVENELDSSQPTP
jgi:hypothetical protein